MCFLRDQRTGRQRDLATLKLQLQFPHRRSFAQTPFSYTTEPFIFHLFQLSLFGEAVNLEKSCDTERKGEEDGGVVSPLRRSWPPDSWDSTKHWVNIYLSYIFIGKERAKEREAGWRAPMLPLQHDREPGERRHICHRINFPLPGTWVSGAAPMRCTHTLMTSDRIQKLPIVGWWTPVKSFHTEIHTAPTESDVQSLLKIDNDTTTDVCVWFLWALVYFIYSLPFYS